MLLHDICLKSLDGVVRMCLVHPKLIATSNSTSNAFELKIDDSAELGISPNGSLACVANSFAVVQSLSPAGFRDATLNR